MGSELVPEDQEMVKREISLMRFPRNFPEISLTFLSKLNFQYIVTYMGCTKLPSQPLCIIMEYVPEGSLKKLIKKPLDFLMKVKIAMDIVKGLSFLHTNSITHRDIKVDNVLVKYFLAFSRN